MIVPRQMKMEVEVEVAGASHRRLQHMVQQTLWQVWRGCGCTR